MRSDRLAEDVLLGLGFEVKVLQVSAESGKKMPDFVVSYKGSSALVEAKLKEDEKAESARREAMLAINGAYVSEHVLGRNETLSGIVRQSTRQLSAPTDMPSNFKILLFLADCINARVVAEQLIDTLYGRTTIVETTKRSTKPCYFYRNSDFFRRRELDAAIVGDLLQGNVRLKICLNPYADRYSAMQTSAFLLPFGQAIIDPIEEEKGGLAYIPDHEIERKESKFTKLFPLYDPVLKHLEKKYQTGVLMRADFNSPEIMVRI